MNGYEELRDRPSDDVYLDRFINDKKSGSKLPLFFVCDQYFFSRLRMEEIPFLAALREEPPTESRASAEDRVVTAASTSRSKISLALLIS